MPTSKRERGGGLTPGYKTFISTRKIQRGAPSVTEMITNFVNFTIKEILNKYPMLIGKVKGRRGGTIMKGRVLTLLVRCSGVQLCNMPS